MPGYLDDFLAEQQAAPQPSAPGAPAAVQAPPAVQAPAQELATDDPISAYMAKRRPAAPIAEMLPPGDLPERPIPESPLGLLDRARLGWAKTPAAQQKMLEGEFGQHNVKLITKGSEAGFAIRKDGKWFDADPSFGWDASGLKDMPGDVAQFVGQHGLKSAAAAKGAAVGLATAGPIGAVVGAGVGAVAEDAVETAGRYALSKLNASDPASLPQNTDELAKQMMGAFLFGAEGELGGRVLHGLGQGTVKALATGIKSLGVTPEGKTFAAKILSVVSGRPEIETRLRVENPQAMVPFDLQARQDTLLNKDSLYQKMKGMVQDTYASYQGKMRALGKQYEPIEQVAKTLEYKPLEPTVNLMKALDEGGYARNGKAIDYQASGGIERGLSHEESKLVDYMVTQGKRIQAKLVAGESLTHQEVKSVMGTIDARLESFDAKISDRYLKKIATEFMVGLKSDLSATLHAKDPKAAEALAALNKKYGPIKDLMKELAGLTEDNRVDGFVRKVIKQDGSYNAELVSTLAETLGAANPTDDILRAHVARNSTGLWGGKKVMGVPLGSPRAAAAIANQGSNALGATSQFADAIPYLHQGLGFLKGVGDKTRQAMLQNPEAIKAFANILSQAHVAEKQTTEQLLQQAGVKQ